MNQHPKISFRYPKILGLNRGIEEKHDKKTNIGKRKSTNWRLGQSLSNRYIFCTSYIVYFANSIFHFFNLFCLAITKCRTQSGKMVNRWKQRFILSNTDYTRDNSRNFNDCKFYNWKNIFAYLGISQKGKDREFSRKNTRNKVKNEAVMNKQFFFAVI